MQWILENPAVWISTLSGAVVSAVAAGWWVKQKYQLQAQLLEQQLTSDARWHEQQLEQLKQQLQAAQQ
ncbi:DNA recombination protein RmuC, partial [Vibrio alginolyticus]|nr:DNA recombination protein RmuC [Vibrio alginolyticus]